MKSVYNVLTYLDYDIVVSNESETIRNASHVILPGVGAFGSAMEKIMSKIEFEALEDEVVKKGKSYLSKQTQVTSNSTPFIESAPDVHDIDTLEDLEIAKFKYSFKTQIQNS